MHRKIVKPLSLLYISILTAHAFAQNSEESSNVTYPSACFEEYAPITVNDMLNRIPGINLVLTTSSSSSSSDRGKRGGLHQDHQG